MSELWITCDGAESGSDAMARDAALAENLPAGEGPSCLVRTHGWTRPTMTIGRAQSAPGAMLEDAARLGVDLVPRPTGGGWLLHLPGDLSVTCVVRGPLGTGEFRGAAGGLARVIAASLEGCGCRAKVHAAHPQAPASRESVCFQRLDREEVSVDGTKIAGVALARVHRSALVQSALPLVHADGHLTAFAERWDSLRSRAADRLSGIHESELARRVLKQAGPELGLTSREFEWTHRWLESARELSQTRYRAVVMSEERS